jgi:hypothetical protein
MSEYLRRPADYREHAAVCRRRAELMAAIYMRNQSNDIADAYDLLVAHMERLHRLG